jgi:hypothetical protein
MKFCKNLVLFICLGCIITACNNNATKEKDAAKQDSTMSSPKTDSVKYTVAMVDNANACWCRH